jgi:hypothetical protein
MFILSFRKIGKEDFTLDWMPLNFSKKIQWKCTRFENGKIACFLLVPEKTNRALVVAPHGGPHSASLDRLCIL